MNLRLRILVLATLLLTPAFGDTLELLSEELEKSRDTVEKPTGRFIELGDDISVAHSNIEAVILRDDRITIFLESGLRVELETKQSSLHPASVRQGVLDYLGADGRSHKAAPVEFQIQAKRALAQLKENPDSDTELIVRMMYTRSLSWQYLMLHCKIQLVSPHSKNRLGEQEEAD